MDAQGNHIGYMAEQEKGLGNAVARQSFRTHRSFVTHVFDRHENEVLRVSFDIENDQLWLCYMANQLSSIVHLPGSIPRSMSTILSTKHPTLTHHPHLSMVSQQDPSLRLHLHQMHVYRHLTSIRCVSLAKPSSSGHPYGESTIFSPTTDPPT